MNICLSVSTGSVLIDDMVHSDSSNVPRVGMKYEGFTKISRIFYYKGDNQQVVCKLIVIWVYYCNNQD